VTCKPDASLKTGSVRFADIHVSLCQEKSTVVLGVLGRARIATLQDSPHANEPLG
jgi:hypothetical protein